MRASQRLIRAEGYGLLIDYNDLPVWLLAFALLVESYPSSDSKAYLYLTQLSSVAVLVRLQEPQVIFAGNGSLKILSKPRRRPRACVQGEP